MKESEFALLVQERIQTVQWGESINEKVVQPLIRDLKANGVEFESEERPLPETVGLSDDEAWVLDGDDGSGYHILEVIYHPLESEYRLRVAREFIARYNQITRIKRIIGPVENRRDALDVVAEITELLRG